MLDDPNVVYEDMCPSSMVLYDALGECTCTECAEECGPGPSTGQCLNCVSVVCMDELDTCLADV